MKFVIFSYSFLPRSGPECYCTARFASALAQAGHQVNVVTMDWPQQVPREVSDFLIAKNLVVTRIPIPVHKGNSNWARIRYLTYERYASEIPEVVKVVKKVLQENGPAILITRSFPWFSFIVGWNCRKMARKWVAHLSDPIPPPWEGTSSLTFKLRRLFGIIWMRRIFKKADYVSLTCETAKRFFKELLGPLYVEDRVFVTTHIGEPSLPQRVKANCIEGEHRALIVHTGSLYGGRGADEMVYAVDELNKKGIACAFVQCGDVDQNMLKKFEGNANVILVNGDDLRLVSAYRDAAAVVFVPDVNTHLPYVPFLPSKFAYQVFTNKPLVLFSKNESMLHKYCEEFPRAGIFFADSEAPNSLIGALQSALSAGLEFDRTALRESFSRKTIVSAFISRLSKDGLEH